MTILVVCMDLLREAAARRWIVVLMVAVTGILATIGLALQMEVVDGALAATALFGEPMGEDIRSVDIALRPIFLAASQIIFYGGTILGILLCAEFGPNLLSEGRIEHLLALPVRRAELLAGTLLGVLALSAAGCLYGTCGLTLILGFKTGYWTSNLILSGLLAIASFGTIYTAMLVAALFVRGTSFSAAVGAGLLIIGIVASHRAELAGLFIPGVGRLLFELSTAPFPRISQIGTLAGDLAQTKPIDALLLTRLVLHQLVFGAAVFAFGVWRFEKKDF